MGRAVPPPPRPTYEELEDIIRRKNKVADDTFWDFHALWSISWLAYQAHESRNVDYNETRYSEAMAYAMKHIADQATAMRQRMDDDHRRASAAITVETEEAR